ncbi:MAG: hypothetical protein KatS3mg102_1521 [Planctomycetota bacterium]|nr:MAG: hypothetical protein KatS3mg102_1521 [Planctomycetota bacterium]
MLGRGAMGAGACWRRTLGVSLPAGVALISGGRGTILNLTEPRQASRIEPCPTAGW